MSYQFFGAITKSVQKGCSVCIAGAALAAAAAGATITLDFDDVVAAPCVSGTSELASAGITLSGPVSERICAGSTTPGGTAYVPASGSNVLFLDNLPPTNSTYKWFFDFDEAVDDFSFVRTAITGDSTGPAWTATALAADGTVLATVGEGTTFAPLAQLFELNIDGISSIRWDSDNTSARTSNVPVLDDISFVTSVAEAPEPAPGYLLATAIALLGVSRARRRRA